MRRKLDGTVAVLSLGQGIGRRRFMNFFSNFLAIFCDFLSPHNRPRIKSSLSRTQGQDKHNRNYLIS